jgi:hypothetical protein
MKWLGHLHFRIKAQETQTLGWPSRSGCVWRWIGPCAGRWIGHDQEAAHGEEGGRALRSDSGRSEGTGNNGFESTPEPGFPSQFLCPAAYNLDPLGPPALSDPFREQPALLLRGVE